MAPLDRVWTCITYVLSYFTFSATEEFGQTPVLPSVVPSRTQSFGSYPSFIPPGGRVGEGDGKGFTCEYPALVGYRSCSTPENRTCWLKNDQTGHEYNLWTNYEDTNQTPFGIHRTYYLNVTDHWLNADGLNFTEAKLFNKTYPGPWIEGCWGDNITIIVKNELKHNGTSIHWHGIRQWLTMHMDGVNGVTQCPIAPGDSFNYTFRAMQYGSAWYHSHYSVQYADGALGPLTLHGPSSNAYDEAKTPLLMTDWGHNSAFSAMYPGGPGLIKPSILLNGKGNITRTNHTWTPKLKVPDAYNITFDNSVVPIEKGLSRSKRYLMRIINTSFDSTFVFSIDNHKLTVVGADFVPIHHYTTTSILVGIGQRYHVIVEANDTIPETQGNYWIRTWKANCFLFNSSSVDPGYERTGILRYNAKSEANPTSASKAWPDISFNCSDEPYDLLKPIIPWTVGHASNPKPGNIGELFSVERNRKPADTMFPFAYFSMGGDGSVDDFVPMRVDYGNPTFVNLNNTARWNPQWVVVTENYTDGSWVYMVIKGKKVDGSNGAHPIHLHGHDFAILQQKEGAKWPNEIKLKFDNPPRRDVVLLPTNGYIVIAFKTDNPGAWLVHCHIADHAGTGLAMQIMERQTDAANIWPSPKTSHALNVTKQGCINWNKWWSNCTNWWPGEGKGCELGELEASPDSGI
ncbi:multicopper oxidase-domain-containing protein [Lophiotrema nucula]|uniref:Multicopper oxidase-domain-containing protein n=1 Tax=Lophiotrema nucula TaxID=690887 RepID=A0A6A5Z7A4_9PLEO|nr:multicopper oxidase-domain-containing protein [Lophiotrema nucula]